MGHPSVSAPQYKRGCMAGPSLTEVVTAARANRCFLLSTFSSLTGLNAAFNLEVHISTPVPRRRRLTFKAGSQLPEAAGLVRSRRRERGRGPCFWALPMGGPRLWLRLSKGSSPQPSRDVALGVPFVQRWWPRSKVTWVDSVTAGVGTIKTHCLGPGTENLLRARGLFS